MGWTRPLVWLLAALVVLGGLPLGTAGAVGATDQLQTEQSASNTSRVEVTAGQQLSTVLAVTSDDVQTEVEATGFELEYERGDDSARAEALAERGEDLRERAEDIREEYEDATEAYEEGELSESAYAQRIATLNARANNVAAGYEQFESRTTNVTESELRAAGVNETAVRAAVEDVDSVRGVGADALLQRFTGTSTGEFEIRTADGVSVEVESEDGETSREIRRPRDGDRGFNVSQPAALNSSLAALSTPPANASWGLEEASVHEDSGYYEFEFTFATANRTGEAEVRVDGSSGEVFRLEEETELTDAAEERREDEREDDEREEEDEREDDEREDEREDDEREEEREADEREDEREDDAANVTADISVTDGTATVTVTDNGSGVDGATVLANDRQVGTTDANGTLSFELPDDDEVEVTVVDGEFEAEFEFERRNGSFVQTDGPDGEFEEPESDDETEETETEEEETEGEETETETEDREMDETEGEEAETEEDDEIETEDDEAEGEEATETEEDDD